MMLCFCFFLKKKLSHDDAAYVTLASARERERTHGLGSRNSRQSSSHSICPPVQGRRKKEKENKMLQKKCGGQKGFDPCTQAVMNAIDTGLPDRPIDPAHLT